jgi:hypothetical protein
MSQVQTAVSCNGVDPSAPDSASSAWVSTRRSAHTVAPARIEFERCKFIDTLGRCVLNLWLADPRIGGIARPITHPYQLSCPANSDYRPMISQRIAEQHWISFAANHARGPTQG